MPDPSTLRAYDYYEAQLAAHQLEAEGHRAEVYGYMYSWAPWPSGGFRIVVFKDGLTGEPLGDGRMPEFGEFPSGTFVRGLDTVLRFLTVVCATIGFGVAVISAIDLLKSIYHSNPEKVLIGVTVILPIALILVILGAGFSVAAHDGYRRGDLVWVALMRTVGCCAIATFSLIFAIVALVVLGIYSSPVPGEELADSDEEDGGDPGTG